MKILLWLRNALAVFMIFCVFVIIMSLVVAHRPQDAIDTLKLFIIAFVLQAVVLFFLRRRA